MLDNSDKFLPGIEEYLETADNKKSVSSKGLEEMVAQIQIKTGLDQKTSSTIVEMFFQEIRNSILRGETVTIRGLGKFFISSPNSSNNKRRVFPVFKPYKKLINDLNDY